MVGGTDLDRAHQNGINSFYPPEPHHSTKQRKQACMACRRRKKRCDGNRLTCSACSRWDVECVYVAPTAPEYSSLELELAAFVQNANTWDPKTIPTTSPSVSLSSLGFPNDFPPLQTSDASAGSAFNAASSDSLTLVGSTDDGVDPSRPLSLNLSSFQPTAAPSQNETIQLTKDFFEQLHPLLPSIHRETFLDRLRGKQAPGLSTPLEWAIVATAARTHRDPTVTSRAGDFLQTALESISQSPLLQENALRDMQAAVWCIFSLYNAGEITKATVLLAQTYTLACLNGLNRLDDPNPIVPVTIKFSPVEEEECRCTLWSLFILDRHINYLISRHLAINDKLWCVNYPLDDRSLQNGLRPEPESYNRDLAALTSNPPGIPLGISFTRFICKAIALLGRITEYKNITMPTGADAQPRMAHFHELQSALACFWVGLPPCVHNVAEVPAENVPQTVWLLIMLHTCSIVLFYITDAERRAAPIGLPSERDNFSCAYKSVHKVVTTLRAISSLALGSVLNPMLASSYFLCCRFILVQWRVTQQQSYKLDLNLVHKVLDRMVEGQAQLSRIYKDIIDQELVRDAQGGGDFQSLQRTDYCFML